MIGDRVIESTHNNDRRIALSSMIKTRGLGPALIVPIDDFKSIPPVPTGTVNPGLLGPLPDMLDAGDLANGSSFFQLIEA